MATVFPVKVKPNAKIRSLTYGEDGTWIAALTSPPVEGKANKELIALLAAQFQCRKADISIKAGASGRIKWIKIEAPLSHNV